MRQSLVGTLRSGGGLMELLGQSPLMISIIPRKSQRPMRDGGSAMFSTTLLVEVEGDQLINLDALAFLASVRKREGKKTRQNPAPCLAGARLPSWFWFP